MTVMQDMLTLSSHLPELTLAVGGMVMREGEPGGAVWVLVDGALDVRKGGQLVNTITEPGALIGEMSILLNSPYGATVVAHRPEQVAPRG